MQHWNKVGRSRAPPHEFLDLSKFAGSQVNSPLGPEEIMAHEERLRALGSSKTTGEKKVARKDRATRTVSVQAVASAPASAREQRNVSDKVPRRRESATTFAPYTTVFSSRPRECQASNSFFAYSDFRSGILTFTDKSSVKASPPKPTVQVQGPRVHSSTLPVPVNRSLLGSYSPDPRAAVRATTAPRKSHSH